MLPWGERLPVRTRLCFLAPRLLWDSFQGCKNTLMMTNLDKSSEEAERVSSDLWLVELTQSSASRGTLENDSPQCCVLIGRPLWRSHWPWWTLAMSYSYHGYGLRCCVELCIFYRRQVCVFVQFVLSEKVKRSNHQDGNKDVKWTSRLLTHTHIWLLLLSDWFQFKCSIYWWLKIYNNNNNTNQDKITINKTCWL